ncbi:MAG: beta-ketoacyl synthase [Lentisphaerae bacterium RIFOXYB12_FULL_65_16]|nr:MAG: beta-ketoacyl synthase [Lentisphaerae bacterium RIFOXYA12_64_32]OGV90021.1 MAG: beta-ketoacyl synthase [Lentisphaerae bacterium RIFOXYB12_FULL_65_16]
MTDVWITDMAVVTGLGDSLATTWQGLMQGRSAIGPVTRFSTDRYTTHVAACVNGLEPESPDGSRLWPLLDQTLAGLGPVPSDALLLTATTKGPIDILENLRRGRPADTQALPMASWLARISRRLGLTTGGINISAACASSTIAVAQGAAAIGAGRAGAAVICCMDLVSEFVFSGFSALQALSPAACRPFDRDRAGLSLGEGAAALVLMPAERARREGQRHLGSVLGWGMANDAAHITAPARDGCGLIQACRQALARAGLEAPMVAAIGAHGTGTVYNDLMELTAFRAVFDGRIPPLHSIKGALGHSLGAAGGIEVAVGLKALAERTAPPTVGLCQPVDGAEGLIQAAPVTIAGDCLLRSNSGFGGINAVLILGRGADW